MESVLLWLSIISCAWWLWVALNWAVGARRMTGLGDQPVPDPALLPSLTVVIPARDEAAVITRSLATVLEGLPPGGEAILVDDRSRDGTGEIARGLASTDDRLRVITVEEVPDRWLGKNHALEVGAEAATGEWLLFTDADVHFGEDCMARALGFAQREGLDHLVAAPEMRTVGFWERTFEPFFIILLLTRLRVWRVNNPRSGSYFGVGAFNLVRRDSYAAAGGHEALKDEVIDDLILGRNLRRTGARQGIVGGRGYLWVRWNIGLAGLVRGVEKNAYAAFGYNPLKVVAGCIGLLSVTALPALAPTVLDGWRIIPGIGVWLAQALLYRMARSFTDAPWFYFLTFPLAAILIVYSIIRSAVLYHVRGGVVWRGTIYRKVGKGL